jgi:rhodanese-related sulfurtransferase
MEKPFNGEAMTTRALKDTLYEQFARIGKAVASPKRIELVDLLCQGERSVDALAAAANMTVKNTSAQLKELRGARLVETRKQGTRVYYRLADEAVCTLFFAVRDLARARLTEVDKIMRDYFEARDDLEPVRREDLLRRVQSGNVVVLDVRPVEEYLAGHIPGAISVPLPELENRLVDLPEGAEFVAYCRGPYCVFAPNAIGHLRAKGFAARRLEDGFPEWKFAGLPVAMGAEEG